MLFGTFKPRNKKDVLFVWIPKTAGFSVRKVLLNNGGKELYHHYDGTINKGIITFGHKSIPALLKNGNIDKDYFEKAYKFAFVRNPWDRIVSLYFYLKKFNKFDYSFEDFCLELDKGIPPVGIYNAEGFSQANAQKDWLVDENGKVFVDFIGRYENLEEDIKKVFDVIGIDHQIGHENKTNHKDYWHYYSKTSREIIGRLHKEDIEMFGYTY